ncbi:hypothetical protein [Streptomyces roseochromogenus]|uniref:Lipoprotein n=1 Tax=Streptomyces roseochromogenus subsp. oscitans DS 12.976 TaxID=1352936 RepID=V6JVA6_STRRC|nr:hypothetical protein [Streptomyces roseochromogenus]EST23840.1 hypothetical protein M878_32230 [Streptomyces roseochromogenus subsp. oscitans DS 12.976]
MASTRRLTSAVLLLALGVAGCTSAGHARPEPTAPRPFQGVTYYGPGSRAALHTAEEHLIAACMRGKGFTYHPQPQPTGPNRLDTSPYLLLTEAQARRDGYGETDAVLRAPRPAGATGTNAHEENDPRWKAALLGTDRHRVYVRLPGTLEFFYDTDSCVSAAGTQLYGRDYQRLYNTFQVLTGRVVNRVTGDARYRAAMRRWQGCMRDAGQRAHTLDEPPAAIQKQLQRAGTDPTALHAVAGQELKLAGTDAGCQRRAGLFDAVAHAQRDAEQAVLRAAGAGADADLARLREARQRAIARATESATPPA